MGREQRLKKALEPDRRKKFVDLMGEPAYFGTHTAGCTKCRGEDQTMTHCLGRDENDPQGCPIDGEHMHVLCKCSNTWLELPADHADNPLTQPDEKFLLAGATQAILCAFLYEIGKNETLAIDTRLVAHFRRRPSTIRLRFGDDGRAQIKLEPWPQLDGAPNAPEIVIASA